MENSRSKLSAKKRQYPTQAPEGGFQPEPMFDVVKLREVYDYFIKHTLETGAIDFFAFLIRLEKDVPLSQQKL